MKGDDEVRAVVGDVFNAAKAQAQQSSAAAYTGDDDNIDSQVRPLLCFNDCLSVRLQCTALRRHHSQVKLL